MKRPDSTGFPDGCLITIDPLRAPVDGNYVVASIGDDDMLVLAVLSTSPWSIDGAPRLEFLNPAFAPVAITPQDAIRGVVCEKVTVERF